MEILLIRHGRSECVNLPGLNVEQYRNWKQDYDRLGVMASNNTYFAVASEQVMRAKYVFTSDLYRAQHSLDLLRSDVNRESHEVFNEINFRTPHISRLKFSTRIWSFITGGLWYYGLITEHETKADVKNRAVTASDMLVQAAEQGVVALVGHGFMNYFIHKELKNRGWRAINKYDSNNWSCMRLQR